MNTPQSAPGVSPELIEIRSESWRYACGKPGKVPPADSASRPALARLWKVAEAAVDNDPKARAFTHAGWRFAVTYAAGHLVVMDWHTARQPWQAGNVADYIRESYPDTMLVIVDGQRPGVQQAEVHLTKREHEVMTHLRYGARNQEIADKMGLQVITVKLHVRSLCRKIGVQNRTQLALWANNML